MWDAIGVLGEMEVTSDQRIILLDGYNNNNTYQTVSEASKDTAWELCQMGLMMLVKSKNAGVFGVENHYKLTKFGFVVAEHCHFLEIVERR